MPQPHTTAKADGPVEGNPLPGVSCTLSGVEVVNALELAARRGKLPGFRRGEGDVAFELEDFGTPWESVLMAHSRPRENGCDLRFTLRMKRGMAWVFAVVLVATVWPGIWLTDSMLRTYFDTYAGWPWWATAVWYLPMTVPFVPGVMWQALRKSRQTAREEAGELIAKVRKLVGGQDAG